MRFSYKDFKQNRYLHLELRTRSEVLLHFEGRFTLCVTFPSHHRSVRMVCVHTVRRVQSPYRTARDRRSAIISIKYAVHCHGMHFPFFVNY